MSGYVKPLPIPDEVSSPYWDAARDGRLLIQRCRACGRHQFYPRAHCAGCFAPGPEWVEASGRGRLHTFTVVHRTAAAGFRDEVPYAFAIVELEEGPFMTANVVDSPLDALRCDMPVRVVFTRAGDAVLPNVTVEAP